MNKFHFFLIIIIFSIFLYDTGHAEQTGTLRLAHSYWWGGEESLDPCSAKRFLPTILILYERLVRPDYKGNPEPCLAESWEFDETGRRFIFYLRKNVQFHDKTLLTADDVVYSFKHILDVNIDSPAASALTLVDPQKFETPDKYTVVFNLKEPFFEFPRILMHYMMRIIPKGSAENIHKTGIGTGPFKLKKIDVKGTTTLIANNKYWGGRPGLKKIEIIQIADKNNQVYALLDGQIDYIGEISPVHARLFNDNKDFIVQSMPNGLLCGFFMNTQKSPFDDVRVRKAMKLVVDRNKIVEIVLRGYGSIGYDHPVWASDPYHLKLNISQNIEQAKELLAEAGYFDGLDVELSVEDEESHMGLMLLAAVVYKQMAAQAGIRVKIDLIPHELYYNVLQKYSNTKIDTPVSFWGLYWYERSAYQVFSEAYISGARWNKTAWSNKKFDKILNYIGQERDFNIRKKKYQTAQRIIADEGSSIILFFNNTIRVFNSDVKGISSNVNEHNIKWVNISKTHQ